MNYKYGGKDFGLKLNDDGQIECSEMRIVAPTVDEVKALIREQVEKDKSLPRVNVLLVSSGDRWGERAKYIVATSTLKDAGTSFYHQVWVTYKDGKGKVSRSKVSVDEVYQDTPENRARLDTYVDLKNQVYSLNQEAKNLMDECTHVSAIQV